MITAYMVLNALERLKERQKEKDYIRFIESHGKREIQNAEAILFAMYLNGEAEKWN